MTARTLELPLLPCPRGKHSPHHHHPTPYETSQNLPLLSYRLPRQDVVWKEHRRKEEKTPDKGNNPLESSSNSGRTGLFSDLGKGFLPGREGHCHVDGVAELTGTERSGSMTA